MSFVIDNIFHKSDSVGQKGFLQNSSSNLQQAVHIDKKIYKCLMCQQYLTSLYHLKMHINGHIYKKLLKCQICQKGFFNNSSLDRHQMVHGLKLYKCLMCQKHFAILSCLKMHLNLHIWKKFQCQICQKDF